MDDYHYDENDYYDWERKVFMLAEIKYDLDEDVMAGYNLLEMFIKGWTPRKVVDVVSREIFD